MSKKTWASLLTILSGIMWGSAGIFVRKFELYHLNSISIIEIRVLPAVLILLIGICLKNPSLLRIRLKDSWIFLAAGWFSMLGLNLCYNYAINTLTLSLSAVLLSIAPVFVLLMAAVIFKEKITVRKVFCIALALLGCILCSGLLQSQLHWSVSGLLIGLLAAFFYGSFSIFSKIALERGYPSLTVTFYSLLAVCIILLPFADWHTAGSMIAQQPVAMPAFMLFHAVCTSVLPYVFYTIGLNSIEAGKASILASGEPVAATVFGILFFNEVPTLSTIIGLAAVLTALVLLTRTDEPIAVNLKDTPQT